MKVDFDVNIPDINSSFEFYYRTAVSSDDILNELWVLVPVTPNVTGNRNSYVNQSILIGGLNGTLLPFNQFQSKIVFTSSNMATAATVRNHKVKFVAT